jgi:hypothetical protein
MKNYKNFNLSYDIDVSATHQPCLIRAIENSIGDVLELGMGMFSTDLIHHMIKDEDRKIVSVEDNRDWMNKFTHNINNKHEFRLIERSVNSWKGIVDEYCERKWGVVFVDQGYGEEIWRPSRNYAVEQLAECSQFVVAHDADIFPEMKKKDYNWIEYIPPVCVDNTRNGPSTYIISKTESIEFLLNHFTKECNRI